ncbi:hypothetical protein CRI94_13485 [Longibacter salinarum]|uniref:Uncharacterized protein n=1 Tax=Longibacter salinarum TaxID=1850348 RepID=A0A2A8CVB7_9BACT|nr:hypothetical protein [Longibacter salinarum]PEN12534.1 hypothetical protein CRI94_13485 [Longibacter salinarum]
MTPSSLESQLRYRRHGYAWARRFIVGLTLCLAVVAGILEHDTEVTSPTSATVAPAPSVVPAESECSSVTAQVHRLPLAPGLGIAL